MARKPRPPRETYADAPRTVGLAFRRSDGSAQSMWLEICRPEQPPEVVLVAPALAAELDRQLHAIVREQAIEQAALEIAGR